MNFGHWKEIFQGLYNSDLISFKLIKSYLNVWHAFFIHKNRMTIISKDGFAQNVPIKIIIPKTCLDFINKSCVFKVVRLPRVTLSPHPCTVACVS